MLKAIRQAVAAGNHGGALPHPERHGIGWQGAGGDVVERFCQELTATGGTPHHAANASAAVDIVLSLIQAKQARRVLLGSGDVLASLPLVDALHRAGVEIVSPPKATRLIISRRTLASPASIISSLRPVASSC